MDETTCHYIDRLVTIEMRSQGEIPRGVTHRLYEAARAVQGDRALTFLAADGLRRALKRGDHVLVATGAGTPPWLPMGETDGPPGAAAVARALDIGLGAKPVVVGEERNILPIIAALDGIGLLTTQDPARFAQRDGCALVIPMPLGAEPGAVFTQDIFERFAPKAAVFVEKAGPNTEGFYNSLLGTGRTKDMMANADLLADAARAAGVFTVGIGDGGNEIGFGKAAEAVRDIQPWGRKSRRPDGSPGVGIVTVTETDVLVPAATSNWGGYGVAAALAGLLGRPDVLHSVADERRMLDRCVAAGAVDGVLCRPVPMVDGTSEETQYAIITMLHDIVGASLRTVTRGF